MPRTNTSGVSNADPVEVKHVLLADGTVKEVNDMPAEEKGEKTSVGNSSSASSKSSESTSAKRVRTSR